MMLTRTREDADPASTKQARKAAETFSEFADEWIERHGKPNKSRVLWQTIGRARSSLSAQRSAR